MEKTNTQTACWAVCLDAGQLQCYQCLQLQVRVLQGLLDGCCASRSWKRSTTCICYCLLQLWVTPSWAVGCAAAQRVELAMHLTSLGVGDISLAQKAALVPDSEMWARPKAQWLVFFFHLRKMTTLQFPPLLPAVARLNVVFLPCSWNFWMNSSLPL